MMSEELCCRARSTRRTTPFSAFTRGKNCSALMNAPWCHSNLGGRYAAFLKRSFFLSCSWDVRGRRAIESFFFAFSIIIIIIIIILQIFVSRVYERKWSDLAFSLPPLQLLADEVEMRRFLKRPRRQLSALLLLLFLCIIINNNKRRKRLLGKKAMLFLMEWRVSVRAWR